jgi:hypothetical protein
MGVAFSTHLVNAQAASVVDCDTNQIHPGTTMNLQIANQEATKGSQIARANGRRWRNGVPQLKSEQIGTESLH